MYTLVLLTLLQVSTASAHGPVERCDREFDPRQVLTANRYATYLMEDNVLGPVRQVERVFGMINTPREPDVFDTLLRRMGPRIEVLPRIGDMVHLSEHLVQVKRGYQALTVRCARVSDVLKENPVFVEAMIHRTETTLANLDQYLTTQPGHDTFWVREHIDRVRGEISRFRRACFDNLPPQAHGFWDAINRVLWP